MTSYSYKPVKDIADAAKNGAGPVIIYGLAAGYKSVIVPTFCLAITIFISFNLGKKIYFGKFFFLSSYL